MTQSWRGPDWAVLRVSRWRCPADVVFEVLVNKDDARQVDTGVTFFAIFARERWPGLLGGGWIQGNRPTPGCEVNDVAGGAFAVRCAGINRAELSNTPDPAGGRTPASITGAGLLTVSSIPTQKFGSLQKQKTDPTIRPLPRNYVPRSRDPNPQICLSVSPARPTRASSRGATTSRSRPVPAAVT